MWHLDQGYAQLIFCSVLLNCLPEKLYQVMLSPIIHESYFFISSLLILDIVNLLKMFVNLIDGVYFPTILIFIYLTIFSWTSFRMFIDHLCFFFGSYLSHISIREAMFINFTDLWCDFYIKVRMLLIKTKMWA